MNKTKIVKVLEADKELSAIWSMQLNESFIKNLVAMGKLSVPVSPLGASSETVGDDGGDAQVIKGNLSANKEKLRLTIATKLADVKTLFNTALVDEEKVNINCALHYIFKIFN